MSVLLDTGFVLALSYTDDTNSSRATDLFEEVTAGEHGAAFVTDYVVDEVLTLIWVRTRRSVAVRQLADLLLAKKPEERPGRLVFVGDAAFHEAARLYLRMHERLSFTDCTSLAAMGELRITKVATFERGFDGLCEVLR